MILQDKVELYHASYVIVENIDLSLCADGKDFGKGFYVTTDYNQAYKFVKTAIKKAYKNGIKLENQNTGYISKFKIAKDITQLRVYEFSEADREWLHCVAEHRKQNLFLNKKRKWNDFDIIVGKIANDTTNQVLTAYINGLYGDVETDLADETAIRLLLPNKLSDQICFKTKKSFDFIQFVGAEKVLINEN
ncbi:MAG: DUF3990 domain-containing protein [Spirochaetaceae bacterium]|nr:DUF3990 domain-containing protein [Spirochaetaceae bacterium]